jgi:hypothetical protein
LGTLAGILFQEKKGWKKNASGLRKRERMLEVELGLTSISRKEKAGNVEINIWKNI